MMYRASRHEADCFDKNSKCFPNPEVGAKREKAGKRDRESFLTLLVTLVALKSIFMEI